MKFDVLTLFPDMFECLNQSIIGRAKEKELIDINLINIRDFSNNKHKTKDAKVIYMTPQGKKLDQKKVEDLAKQNHLIILCGHYEGIDQRVLDKIVDEEVSIGDYVLTGGEIPAMVLIDSVSRYVEGVGNNKK